MDTNVIKRVSRVAIVTAVLALSLLTSAGDAFAANVSAADSGAYPQSPGQGKGVTWEQAPGNAHAYGVTWE
jgi:hypothetical protein